MFCRNCGANIPDGATFCPSCGTAVAAPAAPAEPVQQQPVQQQPVQQQPVQQQPVAQPKPAPVKKKFTGNKLHLLMVIAMFVSAATECWIAMALLLAVEIFFVKDKWVIRNSIQPFAVGAVMVLYTWFTDVFTGLFTHFYTRFGAIMEGIMSYLRDVVLIAGIVFLVIGIITLFTGEVKIPLFSLLGKYFKEEEKPEEKKEKKEEAEKTE